jgi:hypothetical protein
MESSNTPDRIRRRLLLAGAALPAACAAPGPVGAPPAVAPPSPRVSVGDRWHYETIDLFRGVRVGELHAEVLRADPGPAIPAGVQIRDGTDAPLVVALSDARGPLGEELYTRAWDVVHELTFDTAQTYEAPMPLLPDRLEPGARRRDATHYTVPNSTFRLHWRQSLRALRWERLVLPAGSFDTLRIERYVNFRHWDTWREQPWRIDTIWYAPEVRRWVQREWTGQYRWPSRRPVEVNEDRVRWQLLDWQASAG